MSRRKPKRNARREARASKRGFAERTVRELPAVRITPEGREFVRPSSTVEQAMPANEEPARLESPRPAFRGQIGRCPAQEGRHHGHE